MKCPRCQAENREGRRLCAECGTSLAVACSSCGFSNEPGEKFCGGCEQGTREQGVKQEQERGGQVYDGWLRMCFLISSSLFLSCLSFDKFLSTS